MRSQKNSLTLPCIIIVQNLSKSIIILDLAKKEPITDSICICCASSMHQHCWIMEWPKMMLTVCNANPKTKPIRLIFSMTLTILKINKLYIWCSYHQCWRWKVDHQVSWIYSIGKPQKTELMQNSKSQKKNGWPQIHEKKPWRH